MFVSTFCFSKSGSNCPFDQVLFLLKFGPPCSQVEKAWVKFYNEFKVEMVNGLEESTDKVRNLTETLQTKCTGNSCVHPIQVFLFTSTCCPSLSLCACVCLCVYVCAGVGGTSLRGRAASCAGAVDRRLRRQGSAHTSRHRALHRVSVQGKGRGEVLLCG